MLKVSRFLCRLWYAKVALQRFLVVMSGLAITLLIFVQVVSRYVFSTAIFGIEEIACYIAVWLYFLGAAVGAEQRGHMSASLVSLIWQGELAQRVIKLLVGTLSVVISGWMTVWAYGLAKWSLQFNMMSTEINVPVGYAQMAIPVGLALMTLYFFFELIETLVLWARSRGPHA